MEATTKETVRGDKGIKVNPFKLNPWRRLKDLLSGGLMSLVVTAILALILIMGTLLLVRSWPIMSAYPLRDLLTSTTWRPTRGEFGFAPFIVGSLAVTLIAGFIAVIPALLSGIYLAEYTSKRSRTRLKPLLDLLVGIPSVVYGLWAILFIVPLIRDHIGPWSDRVLGGTFPIFARTNPSGYGLLAGGFVLGVMIFPIIVAVTDEVLRNVPREMRESLQALGGYPLGSDQSGGLQGQSTGGVGGRCPRLFSRLRRDAGGDDGGGQQPPHSRFAVRHGLPPARPHRQQLQRDDVNPHVRFRFDGRGAAAAACHFIL